MLCIMAVTTAQKREVHPRCLQPQRHTVRNNTPPVRFNLPGGGGAHVISSEESLPEDVALASGTTTTSWRAHGASFKQSVASLSTARIRERR